MPSPSVITAERDLPREQDSNASRYIALENFGDSVTVPFGDMVYARSGDKGSNVNVGLFFPAGDNSREKWEWLRSFLTRERLCGMYISKLESRFASRLSAEDIVRTPWR